MEAVERRRSPWPLATATAIIGAAQPAGRRPNELQECGTEKIGSRAQSLSFGIDISNALARLHSDHTSLKNNCTALHKEEAERHSITAIIFSSGQVRGQRKRCNISCLSTRLLFSLFLWYVHRVRGRDRTNRSCVWRTDATLIPTQLCSCSRSRSSSVRRSVANNRCRMVG